MSNEKRSFLKQTSRFSGATIISRITGLLRETVNAALFGASGYMDAFVAAFRIPNLLRDLFAEGALSATYVPIFTEKLKKEGKESAFLVTSAVFSILAVALGILVILGVLTAPYFIKFYVSGFADSPEKVKLTVTLTQIMFPFILLVAFAAAGMGTLNSLGRFGIPAAAPAAFNIVTIIAALFFSRYFDPPIMILGIGVVLGGLAQLAIQIPQLKIVGYKFKFRLAFRDEAVQRILKLFLPAAIGVAAWQVNLVVGTMIASHLQVGGISSLYYAFRIVQFPQGTFGIALAAVSLPRLSAFVATGEVGEVGKAQRFALRMVIFLLLPSAAYFIGASEPIVSLAYQRGEFSWADTINVSLALRAYAIGLVFFGLVRVTAQIFYAYKDTATPVKISFVAVALNIILSLLFMGPLRFAGLALATSLAAIANFSLLYYFSHKKAPAPDKYGLIKYFLVILIASAFAAVAAYGTMQLFIGPHGFGGFKKSLVATLATAGATGIVFMIFCIIFKVDEVMNLKRLFRRGKKAPDIKTMNESED